jgi:hypothetical protein
MSRPIPAGLPACSEATPLAGEHGLAAGSGASRTADAAGPDFAIVTT